MTKANSNLTGPTLREVEDDIEQLAELRALKAEVEGLERDMTTKVKRGLAVHPNARGPKHRPELTTSASRRADYDLLAAMLSHAEWQKVVTTTEKSYLKIFPNSEPVAAPKPEGTTERAARFRNNLICQMREKNEAPKLVVDNPQPYSRSAESERWARLREKLFREAGKSKR